MYFNVPQSRQRVIIVGVRNDLGIEPSHPKPQMRPGTVRDALRGLSEIEQDAETGHCWIPAKPGSKTMQALMVTKPGDTLRGFSMSRRLAWDDVCGTIQTGGVAPGYPGSSWPSHPQEHRGISMREAARLASFPDSFTFIDWREGCKRIGNSVPPNLMRAIAEHIKTNILNEFEMGGGG